MSDAVGGAEDGDAGGCTNLAASCADANDSCIALELDSAPTTEKPGDSSAENNGASTEGREDSPDEEAAAQAVVHFQEGGAAAMDAGEADSDPKSKTIARKVLDWCDCDTVWVGCLLLGTGVAFIIFIVFIISG